jgi:hypothetical protein
LFTIEDNMFGIFNVRELPFPPIRQTLLNWCEMCYC